MASDNGQFETDNREGFSDETIRRFLLGALSASEQPAFEQRLLSDQVLARSVHLAELELADDYAYERLNDAERALVQARFLSSAHRRQQVRVSRSLRDHFAPAPESGLTVVHYFQRLRTFFSIAQPAWRFAFTAVILILLVGTVWVVVKKEPAIKEALSKPFRKRTGVPNVPIQSSHPTSITTPEHQVSPSPMPVHDQPAPASVSVALIASASPDSGNMPSVNLPQGEQDMVRLQLALPTVQRGLYRGELFTGDGQSVFSSELVNGDGAQINFDVPARLLKAGAYQIRLDRDNGAGKEDLGSYYFRAQ